MNRATSRPPQADGKKFDSINSSPLSQKPPIVTIGQKPAGQNRTLSLLGVSPQKKPRRLLKITLGLILSVVLLLGTVIVWRAVNLSNKIFVGQKTTIFQKIWSVFGGSQKLIGEDLGQINVLLLGIGGEGHEGPYLSDTIIVAQIRPDLGQVALISIPRDYLAEMPFNGGQKKINNAFSDGFYRNEDWAEAGIWARTAAEKISGLTIPYFTVVDFSGFKQAVDTVGGIDVYIDRNFTDSTYPDEKFGYLPTLTFKQGDEHMDGTRALQFARSRHGTNMEDSDFARSQRQQKVIQALKEKVVNLNIVSDVKKINSLLDVFADHFHTNISPSEILRVYNIVKEKNIKDFLSLSLDLDTNLVCPKILEESGAYVLVPCPDKSKQDIQNFFKNAFAIGKLYQEKSTIWLGNSTTNKKAYQAADIKLKETNLTVWELPFGGEPFPKNIFYQVNPKPATAEFIKNSLNATEVSLPPPGVKIDKEKVDIVVILGENP